MVSTDNVRMVLDGANEVSDGVKKVSDCANLEDIYPFLGDL